MGWDVPIEGVTVFAERDCLVGGGSDRLCNPGSVLKALEVSKAMSIGAMDESGGGMGISPSCQGQG